MSGQLAQQAQEILGKKRPGDPHRAGRRCGPAHRQMVKRGFVEGLDRPLPRHWKPRGAVGLDGGMWLPLFSRKATTGR